MNVNAARIAKLRELMKAHNIDAYIIPTADFHQSEYVSRHFKAREYVTGFTGSAGVSPAGSETSAPAAPLFSAGAGSALTFPPVPFLIFFERTVLKSMENADRYTITATMMSEMYSLYAVKYFS